MSTPFTHEQRTRLHALAKTEAQRLRRLAQDEWLDALWLGMVGRMGRCVHAACRLCTVFRLVRKQHH